jgi:hypothetical protein
MKFTSAATIPEPHFDNIAICLSFAKTPSALKSFTFLSQAGSLSTHDGNPPLSDSLSQILV